MTRKQPYPQLPPADPLVWGPMGNGQLVQVPDLAMIKDLAGYQGLPGLTITISMAYPGVVIDHPTTAASQTPTKGPGDRHRSILAPTHQRRQEILASPLNPPPLITNRGWAADETRCNHLESAVVPMGSLTHTFPNTTVRVIARGLVIPWIHEMNGKIVLGMVTGEITTFTDDGAEAQTQGIEIWHEMRIDVIIYTVVNISYIFLTLLTLILR